MTQAPIPGPLSADDWLTIDTAPKDGSRFESQDRTNYKRRVFTNTYWYVHPAVQGFVTEEIDCTDYEFEPTHWRPSRLAPTAPVEASGSELAKAVARTKEHRDRAHPNYKTMFVNIADLDLILSVIRPQPSGETRAFSVDDLAQEIRRVDGNHDLGAGALAEALMPFLSARPLALGGQQDSGEESQ